MIHPEYGLCMPCTIGEIVDGDTLDVSISVKIRVRLRDCWAPESRTINMGEKKLGLAAKKALENMVTNKEGSLFIPRGEMHQIGDITTLSRILGEVWTKDSVISLNEQMVSTGYASHKKGGKLGE